LKKSISSKIIELGSMEAVETFYSRDSAACLYARQLALRLLGGHSKGGEGRNKYFEKIRNKHSRAYDSWTASDDEHLKNELMTGKKISELSMLFGRTPGAIRSRIKKLRLFQEKEQISVDRNADISQIAQSDNQLKEHKKVVCLAASRKYFGYCIAGKEISEDRRSEWVRPVSSQKTGELSNEEIRIPDGKIPKLLDVIEISVKRHFPHYYQTENYLNDHNRTWAKIGTLSFSDLSGLCDDVNVLWINGYHSSGGFNDRIPLEKANYELASSLLLIRPRNLEILVRDEQTKRKIRAKFDFQEISYTLVITDPIIEEKFNKKRQGIYRLKSNELYLCVSLGEPFEGYCYKLVAAIIYNP